MKLNMLLSLPLGANTAPIGLNKKCGGEALLGFGSVIGALIDSYNVDTTNRTNEDIARMTNESNEKINQNQLAWAREQYKQEVAENRFLVDQAYKRELENRAYNTPAALAARYRAAGINPALAMYGGSSQGSASVNASTGSNPHANQPSMIPMQGYSNIPYTGFGANIANALQLAQNYVGMEHDMTYKKRMADNDTLRALAEVREKGANTAYTNKLSDRLAQQMLFDSEAWNDRIEEIKTANQLHKNQAVLAEQQAEAQRFANSVAPQLHDLEVKRLATSISLAAAEVANINANTALTNQQRATEVERTCQEALRRANLPKSLHNDEAIKVATYKQINKQAGLITQQTATERWRTIDAYKHGLPKSDRPLSDYINYATDALQYTDLNNARGFFRAR